MRKGIVTIIVLILLIVLLIKLLPDLSNDYIKKGNLYISKVIAKNESLQQDNNGEYSDYLVLYNGYNYEINLYGYYLSDAEYETNKWPFPEIVIKPKESLIIYASGNNVCNLSARICHTNFKLSSQGETLTLSDSNGNIINKFTYPVMYADGEYGYNGKKYTYLNSGEEDKTNYKLKNYKIEINEYMTHNKRAFHDKYGNYYDWVELYNSSDTDYEIDGLYISESRNNLKKYLIPKFTFKSNEYKIIYFSQKKVNYGGAYADFALSDDDTEIIISDGEEIVDSVDIVPLEDNISYGKTENGWRYFVTSTPGTKNNTSSFETLGGNKNESP